MLAIAVLALILIPLAPTLVRLRIRFLKWIDWKWGVTLLEDHFQSWVLFFRLALGLVAAVALSVGWAW